MASETPQRIVIAGGGAAGYFAAITCAEACAQSDIRAEITLIEAAPQPLAKVRISGGGRCNVTRACFDPRELVKGYPRGARELLGAFHRWQPRDTIEWFESRGVPLITQPDSRMFPAADSSQAIIDCLQHAAARAGVKVRTKCGLANAVASAAPRSFNLALSTGETLPCDRLLIATGGGAKSGAALTIAEKLGHAIEPPVPSLFTFNIDDPRLRDLAGFAVPRAATAIPGSTPKLRETGPMIITHWGLSGPAILKISAWGARELHARNYHFPLTVNWLGPITTEQARATLAATRASHARRQITTWNPFALSSRLWERLAAAANIPSATTWANLSKTQLAALAAQCTACEFTVTGKSTNKDEFVTCGGVRLGEVDFKTMQSRVCPGLYFAGEVLDIDGITGGYNFQAAWTTGRLAGLAMARKRNTEGAEDHRGQ
ncbi:putative Rossmann fold flavoprotein [Ereboglobus sp. PH5-10]|uniref:NAD(P)/FAD-dependent oxidoreductase n=1 Tax=Ereboglobus sp. PH5-10 TaxID=2940629 RepID=UPI0024060990|nr:NAD(P)/FAD-dependent oxidoreductase [Ereboglobus sp. PH5-10]MDF9828204.1 putative Rossmann fold flavoprotein [Ereboglobus sp. PH5-10]